MHLTHEKLSPMCLFRLHLRMSSAIDDVPFCEKEDEENFDLSLIMSLGADVDPVLAVMASSTISSPN